MGEAPAITAEYYQEMLSRIARLTRSVRTGRKWSNNTIVRHRAALIEQFVQRYHLDPDKTFDDFRHVIAEQAEQLREEAS